MGFDVEAQTPATNTPAIIDVHLHAMAADAFGPPPIPACAAELTFLPRDPKEEYGFDQFASCVSPLKSPMTDDELMRRTLQLLERYNVVAVTSGGVKRVTRWKEAAPARVGIQ